MDEETSIAIEELARKVEEIEREIRNIKQPLVGTLTDLRKLMSEIENPFNYLVKCIETGKLSGLPNEIKPINKREEVYKEIKKEERGKERKRNEESAKEKVTETTQNLIGFASSLFSKEVKHGMVDTTQWQLQLNVLVATEFLLQLFGRQGLRRVVAEYVKDNWISQDIARVVEDAIDKLSIKQEVPEQKNSGLEENLLALYVLYRLSSEPLDPLLPVLLILLKRAKNMDAIWDITAKRIDVGEGRW
jgi:hypothetical protein